MMRRRAILLSMILALLPGLAMPAVAGSVPEPTGYRTEDYRAPVPATLKGAHVVGAAEAEKLWREKGAVFFDVMPRAPKPDNLPKGTIWRDKPRYGIPGSFWLVNVGYGEINADTEAYFRNGLEAQVGADKARPILFYCMTDCWMSWNAARRAVAWGYTSVFWFPLGSDGWEKAGLPLVEEEPYKP